MVISPKVPGCRWSSLLSRHGQELNTQLSGKVHQYTLYGDRRPVGIGSVVAGFDKHDGPGLYLIEPSGTSWVRARWSVARC
jgi:20S proteasome alpha/beta subunit